MMKTTIVPATMPMSSGTPPRAAAIFGPTTGPSLRETNQATASATTLAICFAPPVMAPTTAKNSTSPRMIEIDGHAVPLRCEAVSGS